MPGGTEEHDDRRQSEAIDTGKVARPYSMVVGVLFLVALLIAGVNTLSNRSEGIGSLPAGKPLPRFAAPNATGRLDGDANVNQDDLGGDGDHRTAACDVKGSPRDVVRICDFFDRPLVLVAWFTRGCDTCRGQLDTVERVRRRFPEVAFVGLDIADSKSNAKKLVREHGWGFPMALDRDGAVSGLYRIGGGPLTLFAYPGGITMGTAFGELDEAALVARVEALIRSARRRNLVR
jgi:hypothetical protein